MAFSEPLECRRLMAAVTGFTLVNADTDRDLFPLTDGARIDLAALPTRRLNVRANVSGRVRSVRFGLDGDAAYHTDNTPRYALGGNFARNYYPWTPQSGVHAMAATPYSALRARGAAGTGLAVRFTVVDPPQDVAYSGPLVITRGGVYSGNWESTDPEVAAVTIRTDEPVVIENAHVRGRGDLIETDVDHTHVAVRDTRGYALNPGVDGQSPGRFFDAAGFDSAELVNNYMEGTGGIKLIEYAGDGTAAESVRVVGNSALNIDGRMSDGNGGFLDFNKRKRLSDGVEEEGFEVRQFVQLRKVPNVPGVEIAWNQVVNEVGRSRVEDNINIYKSSGTPDSPIRIHDNYVQGAYTIKPWQGSYNDGTWEYNWRYSGGGILVGDGSSGTAYVHAYDNQVVSTSNYGVGIAAGHDMAFYRNRVVSSGLLPDGRSAWAQNVGVYIWDLYDTGPAGFYNNSARDNLVGWVNAFGDGRNDWWVPDAASFENNSPWPGTITPAVEMAEWAVWQRKLAATGRTVGPSRP